MSLRYIQKLIFDLLKPHNYVPGTTKFSIFRYSTPNAYSSQSLAIIRHWVFQMFTDRSFIHGVHKSAKLHQNVGHRDVFLYHFNYRGTYSFTPVFGNTTKNFGTFRQSSYTRLTERKKEQEQCALSPPSAPTPTL